MCTHICIYIYIPGIYIYIHIVINISAEHISAIHICAECIFGEHITADVLNALWYVHTVLQTYLHGTHGTAYAPQNTCKRRSGVQQTTNRQNIQQIPYTNRRNTLQILYSTTYFL